jgi:hypothetical protein
MSEDKRTDIEFKSKHSSIKVMPTEPHEGSDTVALVQVTEQYASDGMATVQLTEEEAKEVAEALVGHKYDLVEK